MQLQTSHDSILADAEPGCKHSSLSAWSLSVRYIAAAGGKITSAVEELLIERVEVILLRSLRIWQGEKSEKKAKLGQD